MFRLIPIALSLLAGAQPAPPGRHELFSVPELRRMCSGETDETPEFRSSASYRLVAQIARERCRMYLLGIAAAELGDLAQARCIPAGTSPAEMGEALAASLLASPEDGEGNATELVRAALRGRYGCA